MKIYLAEQQNKFDQHLAALKAEAVMTYDKSRLAHKISTIPIATTKNLAQLNLDFLFDYSIFPSHIMAYQTQWSVENRMMQISDTIAQQVYIPPTKIFSQKIVFGVRINALINQPNRVGFSYETLFGHVEKGVSTFTVEQLEGSVIFKIETYSEPANVLTKLLGPVFSVPYQAFCTNQALAHVKRQLEAQ